MAPRVRKLALTAHVIASVGWLGAIVAFLPLAIAGVASRDLRIVRGAYLTMELIGWYALVPLALASLLTGIVQSLGTKWGLFRHYWVLCKLLITVFATGILLTYTQTLGALADLAGRAESSGDVGMLRNASPIQHAGIGALLLLVAAALAVFKPRGTTRYGQRKQREQRALSLR